MRAFAAQGIPYERLAPEEGARLFPSWSPRGLAFLLHEPEAGVLRAQRAVRALARQAAAHGAAVVRARATPDGDRVRLDDGRTLEADAVVWCCGAWLGALFPGVAPVSPTCQELYFFAGGPAWRAPGVPAFVDYDAAIYGTRDLDELGVKAASDHDGPPLAPDAPLPPASSAGEAAVRAFLAERFPALAAAPLTAAKTCRYELTPDGHFLAARHPEQPSVWLLGGGSGHGFKHGPAMAERMAAALRGGVGAARALRPRRARAGTLGAHGGRQPLALGISASSGASSGSDRSPTDVVPVPHRPRRSDPYRQGEVERSPPRLTPGADRRCQPADSRTPGSARASWNRVSRSAVL